MLAAQLIETSEDFHGFLNGKLFQRLVVFRGALEEGLLSIL
jgi:hypothetical protein